MKKVIVILLCLLYVCGSVLSVAASMPMPPKPDDPNSGGTIHLKDIKEYKRWLRTEKLPSDFVCYEQISSLGEFVQFSLTKTYAGDIYSFHYTVRDASGERIRITFRKYAYAFIAYGKLCTQDDATDPQWMTSLKDDSRKGHHAQRIELSNMSYQYLLGRLAAIYFSYADWHCKINCAYYPENREKIEASLPDTIRLTGWERDAKYDLMATPTYLYPSTDETTFARFLNASTAEAELQRLLLEMDENRHHHFSEAEIVLFAAFVALVAVLVAFLIMYKKLKNPHRFGGNEVDNGMSDAESLSSSNETAPPVS
ncbi:MAG: hypothetical protein J6L87_02145 [Clostridia bacterium]|nr:hypothetical protein [Clostridia bacterium]